MLYKKHGQIEENMANLNFLKTMAGSLSHVKVSKFSLVVWNSTCCLDLAPWLSRRRLSSGENRRAVVSASGETLYPSGSRSSKPSPKAVTAKQGCMQTNALAHFFTWYLWQDAWTANSSLQQSLFKCICHMNRTSRIVIAILEFRKKFLRVGKNPWV